MNKSKKKLSQNYLEKIPKRLNNINWYVNDQNIVTLNIQNTGLFNRITQKFFNKSPISYVYLDNIGSFVWPLLDGKMDIIQLGEKVEKQFGGKAEPLYPRLAKFFQILNSYHLIELN